MKKVKFDNSQSFALQQALGETVTPDQSEVMKLEGWLVDDHVCVQKPIPDDDAGWRVSLYPWGHKISFDFFTKEDAVEYAKDVSKLGVDWAAIYSAENFTETKDFQSALTRLIALRDLYEADGYFKSRDDEPS
jgi:hypothetical protein